MIDFFTKLASVYGFGKVTTAIIITAMLVIGTTVYATIIVTKQNSKLEYAVVAAKQNPRTDSVMLCKITHLDGKLDSVLKRVVRIINQQETYQTTNILKFNRLTDGKDELKRSFGELDQMVRSSINILSAQQLEKKNETHLLARTNPTLLNGKLKR